MDGRAEYSNKNTRKFLMKTHKLVARNIKHLLENKSELMIHDLDLVLDVMYTIYWAGDDIILELANWHGNC